LRDLINRVPDAVSGKQAEWMDSSKALDDLKKIWTDEGLSLEPAALPEGEPIPSTPERQIPNRVFDALQRMLRERAEVGGRSAIRAQRMFRALIPPETEPNPVVVQQWVRLGRWAVGSAHFDVVKARDLEWNECCAQLELFEVTLQGVANRFFEVTDVLDEILEDANS
jgi:hypothetical protein